MNHLDHLNSVLVKGLGLDGKKVKSSVKSVFEDGTVDVYKGQRPVTAGWKVVDPAGNVIMGHSLDRRSAVKTTAIQVMNYAPRVPFRKNGSPEYMKQKEEDAKNNGYKSFADWEAQVKIKRAEWRKSSKIEIVEVAR